MGAIIDKSDDRRRVRLYFIVRKHLSQRKLQVIHERKRRIKFLIVYGETQFYSDLQEATRRPHYETL